MKITNKNTVTTDVEFLRQKSTEVSKEDNELRKEIKERLLSSFEYYNKKVQGIAAPQLKMLHRAILVRYEKDAEPKIMFNPKVIFKLGMRAAEERCLSEKDIPYLMIRPILSYVSYEDENGNIKKEFLNYKKGRIFCHEVDHLDGILLQDKGTRI